MKTNQEMMVNIGNNHTIKIGPFNKNGETLRCFCHWHSYREIKLKSIVISEWLERECWEFIYEG